MPGSGIKIDEEAFLSLSESEQMGAIYKAIMSINTEIYSHPVRCEPRFRKLEKRKWMDKGIATGMGVIGGFLGFLGIKIT